MEGLSNFLQTRQDKLEELRKCLQQQLLLNTPSAAVFMFLSHFYGPAGYALL